MNTATRVRAVVMIAVVCVCAMVTRAETARMTRSEAERLFTHGNEVFAAGLSKAKEDRSGAGALFREAASAWRSVAEGLDVQNAKLETNIANASVLGGDLPRAIAAYRRALRLDPRDESARNGLAAARRAAGTEGLVGGAKKIDGGDEADGGVRGAARRIGAMLSRVGGEIALRLPSRVLLDVAAVCYIGVFGLAIARVMGVGQARRWMIGVVAAGCVVCAGPVVLHEFEKTGEGSAEGVVVQGGMMARNGPAELYEAAFKEPVRAGLEVRVEETRGEWSKIRLGDGRTAWMPSAGIEKI